MSKAGTARQEPTRQVLFATSYALGTSTTHTPALMVWRALNTHLLEKGLPMTGDELVQITGLTLPYVENMFDQTYYQKSYGFRRFGTIEAWRSWAEGSGLLYTKPTASEIAETDDEEEPSEA